MCIVDLDFFGFYWMFYDHFSARSLLPKLGHIVDLEIAINIYLSTMIYI